MFLWPDPAGCPAPGVTRHLALWSADFPRLRQSEAAISRPTWGKVMIPPSGRGVNRGRESGLKLTARHGGEEI